MVVVVVVDLVRIARKAEKTGTRRATPIPTSLCPCVSSAPVLRGGWVRLVAASKS